MPLDFHGSDGEQEAYDSLAQLDDSYIVFHSIRWVGRPSSDRSPGQGEADFVIFQPSKGILVIEVKAGNVTLENGVWYQQNRRTGLVTRMKDPEAQASRSKFEIIAALDGKLQSDESCLVCHAVWFTSAPVNKKILPMNMNSEMLLDSTDLPSMEVPSLDYAGFPQIKPQVAASSEDFSHQCGQTSANPEYSGKPVAHN